MANLWIFGDSYSTPGFCVEPRESWWGLLAQKLDITDINNFSWPGNNIDSILHIIVANHELFNKNDYLVIGIPPIERLTVFEDGSRLKNYIKFNQDLRETERKEVPRHNGLRQLTRHQLGRQEVDLWNRSWHEAQILRQILTFLSFIEKICDRVLILNLSEPFQPMTEWTVLNNLQKQVYNDPRVMLDKDTYYSVNYNVNKPVDFDTHKWFGHQGPVGNHHWFKFFIEPKLKNLGWI